jgi:hypothetical protein
LIIIPLFTIMLTVAGLLVCLKKRKGYDKL